MAHAGSVVVTRTELGHPVPAWLILVVGGGGLLLTHVIRALRADNTRALGWLQSRGLHQDPRSVEATRRYLRRLRWSRVVTSGLLIGGCALAAAFMQSWISFVSLPFLLSVLLAESLAPDPRRGRLRSAGLQRRPRSFFAPRWPLLLARSAIAVGVVLSFLGASHGTRMTGHAVLHGVVLLAGAVALELCLGVISLRALPDREPDLSLDTAMRVSGARTATAAALVFGSFGLFLALGLAELGPTPRSTASIVTGQVVTLSMLAAAITAIVLVQPLRSWRPRPTS